MSFKFIKTKDESNQFDQTNVTVEHVMSDASLPQLLESFEEFLKACGYHFDGKTLEFIEEE